MICGCQPNHFNPQESLDAQAACCPGRRRTQAAESDGAAGAASPTLRLAPAAAQRGPARDFSRRNAALCMAARTACCCPMAVELERQSRPELSAPLLLCYLYLSARPVQRARRTAPAGWRPLSVALSCSASMRGGLVSRITYCVSHLPH